MFLLYSFVVVVVIVVVVNVVVLFCLSPLWALRVAGDTACANGSEVAKKETRSVKADVKSFFLAPCGSSRRKFDPLQNGVPIY